MGSWYKTCGLSRLPIMYGDEVLVFALEQNKDDSDRCYTTAFWRPVLVPYYSVYADYGAGENSRGIGLELLINGLKESVVDVEQGENQYHDIAVKAVEMTEELFYEAVHESRLSTTTGRVDFVMFRKDIVDYILNNHRIQRYAGDGKGNSGWGNAYIEYGFKDVLAAVPEFLYVFKEYMKKSQGVFLSIRGMFRRETNFNYVAEYLGIVDSYRMSNIYHIIHTLSELFVQGKEQEAEELVKDALIGCYIESFMYGHRLVWMPGGHEGSQDNDPAPYLTMCSAIQHVIKTQFTEDEENDEDADE